MTDTEVIWLTDRRRFAFLSSRGAFFSDIYWYEEGIEVCDTVENDEYILWEERATDFEHE